MKVMLLFFCLISTFVYADAFLTLKFENKVNKERWIEWYLDKGGEDCSMFYATDWTNDYMDLISDLVSNERNYVLTRESK